MSLSSAGGEIAEVCPPLAPCCPRHSSGLLAGRLSLQFSVSLIALAHCFLLSPVFAASFLLHHLRLVLSNQVVAEEGSQRDDESLFRVKTCLTYLLLCLSSSGLLYVGAQSEEPSRLLPWLLFKSVHFGHSILGILCLSQPIQLFLYLSFLSLDFYLISLVYSLYEQLRRDDGPLNCVFDSVGDVTT